MPQRDRRQVPGGQVMVETAMAAVGLVVMAFLIVRVGMWLNTSMVQRNANFQASRVAAGSGAPGTGFAGPGAIHLIGPGPNTTGGLPAQGPGPSAAPTPCTGQGQAWLAQAVQVRQEVAQRRTDALTRRNKLEDEADKAADLINARPPTHGQRCPEAGLGENYCKGANWYVNMAIRLLDIDAQLPTARGNRDNLLHAWVNAQVHLTECNSWLGDLLHQCTLCYDHGNPDGNNCDLCVHFTDTWLAGNCGTDASLGSHIAQQQHDDALSAYNNAQALVDQLEHDRLVLCNAVTTGNPWALVPPPVCEGNALGNYATHLNDLAHSVANAVSSEADGLRVDGDQIQLRLLMAEELEGRGNADCASH